MTPEVSREATIDPSRAQKQNIRPESESRRDLSASLTGTFGPITRIQVSPISGSPDYGLRLTSSLVPTLAEIVTDMRGRRRQLERLRYSIA